MKFSIKFSLCLCVGLTLYTAVFAQEAPATATTPATTATQSKPQVTANIVLDPYVQALSENSFTVVWKTDMNAIAWVEVAPDDGTHFFAEDRPRYYDNVFGRKTISKLHRVTVDGLEKGKTYRYRVVHHAVLTPVEEKRPIFGVVAGMNPVRGRPYKITTLDRDAETVDFAIINDIHGKDASFRKLLAPVVQDSIDMVFFNGDMLSAIDNEEQLFKGYMRSATELFTDKIPFYHVRGNHETRGAYSYYYMDYFPTTTGKPYYMVRQGPAAFIVLDCGEDKPDSNIEYHNLADFDQQREKEAEWLAQVIETEEFKSAPVKICISHMPSSIDGGHGNREFNRLFIPLLEKAGIDMMISGHVHRYSYSEPGVRGCNFPVLINNPAEKHYFHITADSITAERIDAEGKVLQTYKFK